MSDSATPVDEGETGEPDTDEQTSPETTTRADESAEQPTAESATPERPESTAVESARTNRWATWLAGSVLLVGMGVAYGAPTIVATAAVPLAYVLYGALSAVPDPTAVRVERRVADDRATPGDPVTVETTVTVPEGTTPADLRLLDGVPDELAVTDGTPRAATPVRPGGSVTLRYTLTAQRGSYGFDPVRVRVRSLAGSAVASADALAEGDTTLTCAPPGAGVPVTRPAPRRAGTASADSGGEGLAFYSTREYRRGDPVSRINWRSYAKRGELVTTTYEEERRARAVVVCDVRPVTRRSPAPGSPTGAGLAAYTAETAVAHLRAAGHEVGLAVLGIDQSDVDVRVPTAGGAVWLPEAGGVGGRQSGVAARRTRAVMDAASAAGRDRQPESPGSGESITPDDRDQRGANQLAAVAPGDAHVVIVSPFVDGVPLAYARRFALSGSAVTVLSPDPTGDTLGGRTASIDRRLRLRRIEAACETVVDWPADKSLALAVARAVGPGSKAGRGSNGRRGSDSGATDGSSGGEP